MISIFPSALFWLVLPRKREKGGGGGEHSVHVWMQMCHLKLSYKEHIYIINMVFGFNNMSCLNIANKAINSSEPFLRYLNLLR